MSDITLQDILNCPSLPSLPAAAVEVLDLTRDTNVNLRQVADVIQNDPALTAKILKTINSSYYGLSRPCPTILRALTYLGLNTVKSLVLGFSLVDITKSCDTDFDFSQYWQRSLYAAAAARRIAAMHQKTDAEEVFIAALMQDIGMLGLQMTLPHDYGEIISKTDNDHCRLAAVEQEAIKLDHAEVGGAFAARWRLPEHLADAIRHHHDADNCDSTCDERHHFVRTVALAVDLVVAMNLDDPDQALEDVCRLSNEWFDISRDQVDELLQQVIDDARQLAQLFKVDIAKPPEINRLLSEAQDESAKVQIEQQREVDSLQREHDQLTIRAATDKLTEVGNRARFDDALETLFRQSRDHGTAMALMLVDVDHFKRFNDTYGHQAGDAVLVELARRMGEVVRDHDIVCRYGGEEFAVVMPGVDSRTATAVAERLRRTIAESPFTIDDPDESGTAACHVTASIGVAAIERKSESRITSADMLVRIVDKAMYAAKGAGRNCVRVYRPRAADAA